VTKGEDPVPVYRTLAERQALLEKAVEAHSSL